MDVCNDTYKTTIFVIFSIILITLFISVIILMLNIINYSLFTVYCIGDNIYEYTADVPDDIILGTKYKFMLLNYIKNINDNAANAGTASVIKEYYDTNSSGLYLHKTIIYYNYVVKLLLAIVLIIVIMLLYNLFYIGMMAIGNCNDGNDNTCGFLLSDILANDAYIYYIIIVVFLYIYAHSYLYTYFFNKNIYAELYDIYAGEEGTAGVAGEEGENKYKTIDTIVSNSINYIHTKTVDKKYTDTTTNISLFLTDLNNMSFDILDISKILANNTSGGEPNILLLMNEGILNNNKFIVPTKLEKTGDINILLKRIYNTPIAELDEEKQRLLGHQIFIYLIYNYVITNSIEDPFIIHKLNNIYLNLFNNLYSKYKKDAAAADADDDPNNLIDSLEPDVRKMFKDVRGAFAVKLLLPSGTDKNKVLLKLHDNADLMLKYIKMVKDNNKSPKSKEETPKIADLVNYKNTVVPTTNPLYTLITTIKENIDGFANGFSDYYQEDKTLAVINRVVYKINFYLAIDMMITIIYILIVLLILYKSGKYPYMEKQIDIAITYAILIINELISAILGII